MPKILKKILLGVLVFIVSVSLALNMGFLPIVIKKIISQFIPLYIDLLITILGFSLPIIGILLSFFSDGIKKLTTKYENEISKNKDDIIALTKLSKKEKVIEKIEKNLKKLKNLQHETTIKLTYLNPKSLLLRLFIFFLLSIFLIKGALMIEGNLFFYWLVIVSFLFCLYAFNILRVLIGILMELFEITNEEKRSDYTGITDLVSQLIKTQKGGLSYFLKKVFITINSVFVTNEKPKISLNLGQKQNASVSFWNKEPRMAKNIEIGFILPPDFILEKTKDYAIFTRKDGFNIIRYYIESVQGGTNQLQDPLVVTPLKEGSYEIDTFIKAENIEVIRRKLIIEVQ